MIAPPPDVDYRSRGDVSQTEFDEIMARYRSASDEAIAGLPGFTDIPYDDHSAERLDVWGSQPGEKRPVVLAIHGGYWRMLSRHDTAFMSKALAAQGIATITVDYTLAPIAPLTEIVRQVRAAVAWTYHHGAEFGLDPQRIHVLGSSAGAHLAAMCAVGGWQEAVGLPSNLVKSAMLLSGLYDLRPLVNTFANEWLNLDNESASNMSPILAPPSTARAYIARAEREASGFHYQSRIFHEHWKPHGAGESRVIPGRNHFDVFLDLSVPGSTLSHALLQLVQETHHEAASYGSAG